jgi:quinohemoprotein ethanol dehydrogenase
LRGFAGARQDSGWHALQQSAAAGAAFWGTRAPFAIGGSYGIVGCNKKPGETPMRRICLAVIAASIALPPAALAQQAQDLRKPAGTEWLTIGGDWNNSRYSTLTQINRDNVKNLKGAWVVHLGSGLGSKYSLEGTPIVKDGVMYIASGNDDVFALDGKTGALIWERRSHIEQNISTVCCGWDNRGVAVGEDKVFLGQLDGSFVALDAKTGKEIWKTQVARWQDGYTITSAPLYHNGVLYSGISGGDRSARGFVFALDAKTGKEKWRWYTVPAPGEFGSDTWPKGDDPDPKRANAWKVGGAAVWQTPAIDPDLGMIYFSTGNPGPEAGGMGRDRPGDNLFSSSIVALKLDGTYAWHFQQVHHDLWDFDCPSPVVLFEQMYDGQMRKGIAEACKTGWIYILDRATGKPLIGIDEKPVETDERVASSPTQPIPRGDAIMPQCPQPLGTWVTKCIFGVIYDQPILQSPGGNGGVNWAPMAYSPRTGFFYATAADRPQPRILRGLRLTVSPAIGAKYGGTLTAVDSRTNKIVWQKRTPYSIGQGSGALVTASDLLFHGEPDGNVQAHDAKTGELLWQWQTGAGADAPAITYEIDGTQYVAIAAGGVSIQTTSANSDMIWVFSLNGTPGDRLKRFDPPKPPENVVGFSGPVARGNQIKIEDYSYGPQRITVAAGTKVTFTNNGSQPHNAMSADAGGWDTGMLAKGETASVTFNRPGSFTYICTPHPSMIGQIIVTGQAVANAQPVVVETRSGSQPQSSDHGAH